MSAKGKHTGMKDLVSTEILISLRINKLLSLKNLFSKLCFSVQQTAESRRPVI